MKVKDLVEILMTLNQDAEIISTPDDNMVHKKKYVFYENIGWVEEKNLEEDKQN